MKTKDKTKLSTTADMARDAYLAGCVDTLLESPVVLHMSARDMLTFLMHSRLDAQKIAIRVELGEEI